MSRTAHWLNDRLWLGRNANTAREGAHIVNVCHIITRMILGGAQENTLQTCINQHTLHGDQVSLITGPAIGPEGSLLERAGRAGFRVDLVPSLLRSIHPWYDWQAYRTIRRLLEEIRPDIVHTHSSKAGILGRLAAYRLKIPVVHTIHGASFHYGQRPLTYRSYVALEKMAAKWTGHFISVCDDMSQEYIQAGIATPDRFTTVYSGFDVEPFLHPPRPPIEVRQELGLSPDDIVVGKIGRLFHLKGHEFILQAAPRVIAANPKVKFLFVGDGILRGQYEQQIADMGLQSHFVFSGLVPPTRIPELMAAMDIAAHTSQWEGLARVLPQALIAGRPVISYDVGGAREVVLNGETGFLLPRDAVDPLIDAILDLAGNPEKRHQFGMRGRALFADRFRHQTMSAGIGAVYDQVLNGS